MFPEPYVQSLVKIGSVTVEIFVRVVVLLVTGLKQSQLHVLRLRLKFDNRRGKNNSRR